MCRTISAAIYLLPSVVERFAAYFSDTISPGLTFAADTRPEGDLAITLDNGYTTLIPNSHLFTPIRGSDKNGHYVVTNSSVLETAIVDNAKDDPTTVQPLLGGLYLTFNYLIVDYENNRFKMAPAKQDIGDTESNITAVCTPPATTSVSAPQPSHTNPSGSSKAGAIAGGTVGAIAGIAAIIAFCFFLLRKRRRRRQQGQMRAEKTTSQVMNSAEPTEPFVDTRPPSELPLVCDSGSCSLLFCFPLI